jgi:large subunit ribosomal protein L11
MAKQLVGSAKFQIPGGQATPAPPVGTALGKFGVNLGQFVQAFNDKTKEANGMMIPVVVNVYNDRSFDFIIHLKMTAGSGVFKFRKIVRGCESPGACSAGKI